MNNFNKSSHLSRAAVLAILILPVAQVGAAGTNLTYKAEATLKEIYDSDVYLQDNAPNPANVAAAQAAGLKPVEANKGSFVTSILPKVGLDYKPCSAFNLSLGYAPEIVFYHSTPDEDYVTHRFLFNFGGKLGDATWELVNTATYIDGGTEGPTFARPDDIPAIGGIPLRDRRAAFIFRNGFRLTEPVGKWFFRPVATSYIHDFKTEQLYQASKAQFSYENYIDRQDINGGLDVGYDIGKKSYLVAGYRYGRQDQFTLPGNAYQRILLGFEGSPVSWLKLAVLGGPDIRQWDSTTPAGFDRTGIRYYWDASATLLPTGNDTVTLKSTRYEQPAFSSFSMYEDTKTDLAWRHKFNDQFAATVGFTLYVGDWEKPVNRDDWIYTPSAGLTYNYNKHLSAEFAYSYDWVDSKISASVEPLTNSHEFTRHLISLAVKYAF
jgi:hypothetical protein